MDDREEVAKRIMPARPSDSAPSQSDMSGIFRQVPVGRTLNDEQRQKHQKAVDDRGFTQFFQPAQDGRSGSEVSNERGEEEVAWNQVPGPGDFTRMFQPLPAEPKQESQSMNTPQQNARAPRQSPMDSGFTQLLRTLSSEEPATFSSDAPVPPLSTPPPSGPGEFTRIISRSAIREASMREPLRPVEENLPAQPRAVDTPSQSAAPLQGLPQPQTYAQPLPPATPVTVPKQSTGSGEDKMQRYVHVLVTANLLLTAMVLILVTVLLARH
ncbi:hypothetical protein [Silvibacterium acidisoli]|uniref:hypothetical protein n=1 Tax=Acidobacteriaceae bacterium ZG23-2 TaxID=2883246 RepID=UPI00406C3BEB